MRDRESYCATKKRGGGTYVKCFLCVCPRRRTASHCRIFRAGIAVPMTAGVVNQEGISKDICTSRNAQAVAPFWIRMFPKSGPENFKGITFQDTNLYLFLSLLLPHFKSFKLRFSSSELSFTAFFASRFPAVGRLRGRAIPTLPSAWRWGHSET